jgi:hypothetical protein
MTTPTEADVAALKADWLVRVRAEDKALKAARLHWKAAPAARQASQAELDAYAAWGAARQALKQSTTTTKETDQ